MQNLDSSFLLVDERGNIMPKTPEAALVAAQAYLLTTQPAPGDPRESVHQDAIKGLRLIGDKLHQGKISQHDRLPHHRSKPSREGEAEGPGLHTMKHHNHVGPGHPGRQFAVHGMETQEASSHRHG
jgi:hypothetical protein